MSGERPSFRVGVGLRPTHYPYLESGASVRVGWFEAISENYMDTQGRPLDVLLKLRERFPVALHGVSMSIGSPAGAGDGYLSRLRRLVDRVQPFLVSDHLCWTRHDAHSLHDLLPFAYDEASLAVVAANVARAQAALDRRLYLENISAYIAFHDDAMAEVQFVRELQRKTGCGMLLDLNNLYVNSVNYRFDARRYFDALPLDNVGQIHLAGYTDTGKFLFDTHAAPVADGVWSLVEYALPKLPGVPVLLEWDADIPPFTIVEAEALKVVRYLRDMEVAA